MLSAYGAEVVAFYPADSGGYLCPECAAGEFSAVGVTLAENGRHDSLSPVIRYSLQTDEGERAWEYAEEHLSEFEERFPGLAQRLVQVRNHPGRDAAAWRLADYSRRQRILDRLSDRFEDMARETCGNCYRPLT